MNNDNGANDANDNGDGHDVGQPETERQELLQLRRKFERQQQLLLRSKHNCSWNASNGYKMLQMLVWSNWREGDNFLKHELLKLAFLRGSNNNKPNW